MRTIDQDLPLSPAFHPPSMSDAVPSLRCLALLSGGLDSMLAARVVMEQGIPVTGLSFESPFFSAARARQAAATLGIPLHVDDFTATIIRIVAHPAHGFGSAMNPCIDCHAAMIRRAGELLAELGCRFVVTGEVLNQRPMSQNRRSLDIVANDSGICDLLLRPLCARLLSATMPEREGWIDRDRLLNFSGRSRKPQMALAARFGITAYASPAGGCLLTEPTFCCRVKDILDHGALDNAAGLKRLRLGRHYRLGPSVKLVVGRNRVENEALLPTAETGEVVVDCRAVPGPVGIVDRGASEEQILAAAAICAAHSDGRLRERVPVTICAIAGSPRALEVSPARPEDLRQTRIE